MLSLGTPASFAFRMAAAKRLLSSGFADPPAMSQWLGESRKAAWAWTTDLWLQIEYPMAENEPPRTEEKPREQCLHGRLCHRFLTFLTSFCIAVLDFQPLGTRSVGGPEFERLSGTYLVMACETRRGH